MKTTANKAAPKPRPRQGSLEYEAARNQMTKTQVIRYMAEQMEAPPKQIAAFFNLLIETASTQTRTLGEFTIPGLGETIKIRPRRP